MDCWTLLTVVLTEAFWVCRELWLVVGFVAGCGGLLRLVEVVEGCEESLRHGCRGCCWFMRVVEAGWAKDPCSGAAQILQKYIRVGGLGGLLRSGSSTGGRQHTAGRKQPAASRE